MEAVGRQLDALEYARLFGYVHLFFFAIVIAGVSVSAACDAHDYLLLIRPAKRYKVLLSKYLSCILTTLALIILSFGAYLLASVLICGAGDLSLPYLFVSDGAVVEFDFLRWMLLRVLYCSASVLFLLTMTFTASTVFRNTAFAVSSGLFTFFSSILLSTFFRNSTLYGYLPFPYFNISSFVFNDLVTLPRDHLAHGRRNRRVSDLRVHLAGRADGRLPDHCVCDIYEKGCDEYLNEGNGLCQREKFAVRTRVPVRGHGGTAEGAASLPRPHRFYARPRPNHPFQILPAADA
ncbi:MAG: ABC transporter permease [Acutalibacteraceae bacterium]